MLISKTTFFIVAGLLLAGGCYFAITAYMGDTQEARTRLYQDKYTECAGRTSEVWIAVNPPIFGAGLKDYTSPEVSQYNSALDTALKPHTYVSLACHADLK
jgi:hypothetical protein